MNAFKYILSFTIFLLLACSCSQLFYTDFDEDVVVKFNSDSPLGSHIQVSHWTNIPHPADGFNIVTKATFIAQALNQQDTASVSHATLAL